jgi:hypothetical protein
LAGEIGVNYRYRSSPDTAFGATAIVTLHRNAKDFVGNPKVLLGLFYAHFFSGRLSQSVIDHLNPRFFELRTKNR